MNWILTLDTRVTLYKLTFHYSFELLCTTLWLYVCNCNIAPILRSLFWYYNSCIHKILCNLYIMQSTQGIYYLTIYIIKRLLYDGLTVFISMYLYDIKLYEQKFILLVFFVPFLCFFVAFFICMCVYCCLFVVCVYFSFFLFVTSLFVCSFVFCLFVEYMQ